MTVDRFWMHIISYRTLCGEKCSESGNSVSLHNYCFRMFHVGIAGLGPWVPKVEVKAVWVACIRDFLGVCE